jgi:hypothetical protein
METGDLIKVGYGGKVFDCVVIDPNGLGKGQPSVGFGFRMAEKYAGIPHNTLSNWVVELEQEKVLKLPSGKGFRVVEIVGSDDNTYSVIEASEWFNIAVDILVNPGRTGKGLKAKLGNFVNWFAVKGFYAEAYTSLKGSYTSKDSRATSKWLEARNQGIAARKTYTDLLQSEGCQGTEFGYWTNQIYRGLFGKSAVEMKNTWELVNSDKNIARNYIPESTGLTAVSFCEDLVNRIYCGDLKEAHQEAITITKKKFLAEFPV